jgi:hypothetical protein
MIFMRGYAEELTANERPAVVSGPGCVGSVRQSYHKKESEEINPLTLS